jgi:hypothetical protein
MQELKLKDYVFTAVCKYIINRPLTAFFPKYENSDNIVLELKESAGVYQVSNKIPFGDLDISKIQYRDKEGNVKETFDFSKNKLTIEKYPDPLLPQEKENLVKKKEEILKLKQNSLTLNIKKIEEMKKTEHQRLNELEQFLSSIPFTLDEIFEYTTKEIQDCEKDMIPVFAYMEKDEYAIFRKLYEIFNDYQIFYDDENSNNTLDVEGMMNFFRNYFDYSKDELGSLIVDFQKLYISRIEESMEYNFLEFVYTILYLLFNIQIYKNIIIEAELKNICKIHDMKSIEKAFTAMFKDDGVVLILNLNADFLKSLFMRFSSKKFETYYEMTVNQFFSMAKEISQKKGHDYFKMTQDVKSNDGLNFFDFLERIVYIGIVTFENNDFDYQTKVESFITDLKILYEPQLD